MGHGDTLCFTDSMASFSEADKDPRQYCVVLQYSEGPGLDCRLEYHFHEIDKCPMCQLVNKHKHNAKELDRMIVLAQTVSQNMLNKYHELNSFFRGPGGYILSNPDSKYPYSITQVEYIAIKTDKMLVSFYPIKGETEHRRMIMFRED